MSGDLGIIGQAFVGVAQFFYQAFTKSVYGGSWSWELLVSGICLILAGFKWGAIMSTLKVWLQVALVLFGFVLIAAGLGFFSVGGS